MNYFQRIEDPHVRHALERIVDAINQAQQAVTSVQEKTPTIGQIAASLIVGGTNPINVTGLQGMLATVQPSAKIGTHAQRLTTAPMLGVFFVETDRQALYVGEHSGLSVIWEWTGGCMVDVFASRPSDLGTTDTGFLFVDSTSVQQTQWVWLGTAWVTIGGFLELVSDAATATITPNLRLKHATSGAPAAGFGSGLDTVLDSSTNVERVATELASRWEVATNASETSSWAVRLRNSGAAIADFFKVLVTGIRFNVGGFFGIFTHANSADRTYTLANESGNIVYQTAGLTDHAIVLGSGGAKVKAGTLGTTTTVLHGNPSGDPAYSSVIEDDISLSNVTTNDATTSRHGFSPILPNDATKYYDGTGAFTVPAGSGGGSIQVFKNLGQTNNIIQVASNAAFNLGSPSKMTVRMWCYLTIPNTNNGLASRGNLSSSQGDWALGFFNGSTSVPSLRVDNNAASVSCPFSLSPGLWYFIEATFDSSLGSNNLKLFVNGVFVAQATRAVALTNNAVALSLGSYFDSLHGFNGMISQFEFCANFIRNTTDYTPPQTLTPDANTTVFWRVTGTTTATIGTDTSGNGFNGTFSSSVAGSVFDPTPVQAPIP